MNFKQRLTALLLSGVIALSFTACGGTQPSDQPAGGESSSVLTEEEQTPSSQEGMILTSNLTDTASREELDQVMENAGISDTRRQVFWNHVDQFNQCEGVTGLTNGYELISPNEPDYDEYDLQDAWDAAYPDFVGYNCRITAFSLMGDYITVENTENPDDSVLFLDEDALEADGSALLNEGDLAQFQALFSVLEAADSTDSSQQAEVVKQAWQERGVTFDDSVPMSLITVFFHDKFSEEDNELMIGHAGVLFDCGEDGLYFVEKLAFQAPYRVSKFTQRSELNDYLMTMYDIDEGQPTAKPFVMENDKMMME